jgi:hypothetical protein
MARDALDHFGVAGLGGGDIDGAQTAGEGSALGERALTRTGTAKNKFFHIKLL